jgi:hypothetical protein
MVSALQKGKCNHQGIVLKAGEGGLTNKALAASFLRTLLYFDVFSYPLTCDEIFNYSSWQNLDKNEGIKTLENLLENQFINTHMGFYFLGEDSQKVSQRVAGNKLAVKRMKQARFFSGIIASFPFTRGVYISGSLSKGYMDNESDIDYFILTSPGRLWLCRTMLVMFKKVFLLNSHKNFCINYLVDTNNLEIKERNIYTATEVALLLPMHNYRLFSEFMNANSWVKDYYPRLSQGEGQPVKGFPFVKKVLEIILDNRLGDFLDNYFFRVTTKFWQNKHGKNEVSKPDSELFWNKHVSQYNPGHFRMNVLKRFRKKLDDFEAQYGFVVSEY